MDQQIIIVPSKFNLKEHVNNFQDFVNITLQRTRSDLSRSLQYFSARRKIKHQCKTCFYLEKTVWAFWRCSSIRKPEQGVLESLRACSLQISAEPGAARPQGWTSWASLAGLGPPGSSTVPRSASSKASAVLSPGPRNRTVPQQGRGKGSRRCAMFLSSGFSLLNYLVKQK